MSLEMMTWAKRQFGLKSAKMVLLILADEADSSGVCFLGQAKLAWLCEMSDRTVREHLKTLEAKDLLHRERRPADFVRGGRKVDAIVLHDHVELARPEFPGVEQERRTAAANRRYRVSYAEEERSGGRGVYPSQDQPEVSSGSPVDNYVSPSQPEPEVSSGKADLTGRITSFEPEESRKNAPGALKGSRARTNPSNPIQSSAPAPRAADRAGSDRIWMTPRPQPARPVPPGRLRPRQAPRGRCWGFPCGSCGPSSAGRPECSVGSMTRPWLR
ncbi:helix-turn-helix domain-containing protein [Rothia kristinae]|uniref:Helix-turn-helix domain-containing protein n=1 Tax=Rothia kristinae TaxID=37923 RepID=A0A7T4T548_9MICC|nr:helix-turn-helix domain-containing protein [Rothia kristinae]QQC59960.1 helix-turn-helix domain-containing protein [Rothia kristinae]